MSRPTVHAYVCDTCNRMVIRSEGCWAYTTRNTGTREQAQRGEAFWCSDPGWAVCPDCEPFIEADDREGLMQRWLDHNPTSTQDQRLYAANVLAGLCSNRVPERVWHEVWPVTA